MADLSRLESGACSHGRTSLAVERNSLVPLLRDPSVEWNKLTLSTHGYENHAGVSSRYKYIRCADGSEELYDVQNDPDEWTNVAGGVQYAEYLPTNTAPAGPGPGSARSAAAAVETAR